MNKQLREGKYQLENKKAKKIEMASQTGFEPAQVKPNALAGRRLNHSATGTPMALYNFQIYIRYR